MKVESEKFLRDFAAQELLYKTTSQFDPRWPATTCDNGQKEDGGDFFMTGDEILGS